MYDKTQHKIKYDSKGNPLQPKTKIGKKMFIILIRFAIIFGTPLFLGILQKRKNYN